ncbi:putative ATP-dependent RNA helicase DDX52 isoform X2 [Stigmatopora argus]
MDAHELFRKLGAGAKFDLKRFAQDASRFRVVRTPAGNASSDELSTIDYFGSGLTNGAQSTTKYQEDEHEDEEVQETETLNSKRKLNEKESKVEKKKKTDKLTGCVDRPNNTKVGGIIWTSALEGQIRNDTSEGKEKKLLKRQKQLHREKLNRVRATHHIHVHGSDVPDPVCTFEELQSMYKLDPLVIQNLREAALSVPTPIQMQAIPLMMQGREVLACAPTGSGKTLAFCLPILSSLQRPAKLGFRALVISPTRELSNQTHREMLRFSEGLGLRIHILNKAAVASNRFGPQSNKKYDVLISTPNRLVFMLKQEPPAIDLSNVEWLVVDESDKLFEDGKTGFRDQLAAIFLACSNAKARKAFFSATCTQEVEKWCRLNLDNLVSVNIGHKNTAVESVKQELLFVGTENGKMVAVRDIVKKGFMPPVLVFVQSIERAQELFRELVYEGINVEVIHAERTQQQRDNVVESFRRGQIWVLICTALLARGIDFKGVNLVINYDFPTSAVEYIHRIGRTGRAGHQGKAITFFTENDKPLLRSIANVIKQAGCPVPDYMLGFKKMHSKLRRRIEKKPPGRSTICTTPRFLMKKKPSKVQKKATGKTAEKQGKKPAKTVKTANSLKKQVRRKKKTQEK